jgi:hypothetical protein
MAGRSPRPDDPAPERTVVPLRVPPRRRPGTGFYLADLMNGVPAVVVWPADGRVYLFPLEIFSLAADLVGTDPASLVQAGAGLDVTMFFDASRIARLSQAIAICRARQQGDLSRSAHSLRAAGGPES